MDALAPAAEEAVQEVREGAKRRRHEGSGGDESDGLHGAAADARVLLLPPQTARLVAAGSVQQLLAGLEGEFCRHLFSPCSLAGVRRSQLMPPTAVVIELSGIASAAVDAAQRALCERGADFQHEWCAHVVSPCPATLASPTLSIPLPARRPDARQCAHRSMLRVGARIVGEERGSPLPPGALQRAVLLCHLGLQLGQLRQLCSEILLATQGSPGLL